MTRLLFTGVIFSLLFAAHAAAQEQHVETAPVGAGPGLGTSAAAGASTLQIQKLDTQSTQALSVQSAPSAAMAAAPVAAAAGGAGGGPPPEELPHAHVHVHHHLGCEDRNAPEICRWDDSGKIDCVCP